MHDSQGVETVLQVSFVYAASWTGCASLILHAEERECRRTGNAIEAVEVGSTRGTRSDSWVCDGSFGLNRLVLCKGDTVEYQIRSIEAGFPHPIQMMTASSGLIVDKSASRTRFTHIGVVVP